MSKLKFAFWDVLGWYPPFLDTLRKTTRHWVYPLWPSSPLRRPCSPSTASRRFTLALWASHLPMKMLVTAPELCPSGCEKSWNLSLPSFILGWKSCAQNSILVDGWSSSSSKQCHVVGYIPHFHPFSDKTSWKSLWNQIQSKFLRLKSHESCPFQGWPWRHPITLHTPHTSVSLSSLSPGLTWQKVSPSWSYHGVTVIRGRFSNQLIYPLVMTNIAIENGHL